MVNTSFLLDDQIQPNPDTTCTDSPPPPQKKRAMNTIMGEISAGEAPRLTAKSIHPINSVICYVHFLKKNFIESDELEFRMGFKSTIYIMFVPTEYLHAE